jgi:hypothetical protein
MTEHLPANSATPRTDAVAEPIFNLNKCRLGEYAPASIARQLELELAELQQKLTQAEQLAVRQANQLRRVRDMESNDPPNARQPPSSERLRRYRFTKSGMFHDADGEWVSWFDRDQEISRLENRLEVFDDNGERLPEHCDGIASRDATIHLMDERIERLEAHSAEVEGEYSNYHDWASGEIERLQAGVKLLENVNADLGAKLRASNAGPKPPHEREPYDAEAIAAESLITRIKADIIEHTQEDLEDGWMVEDEQHCATLDLLFEAMRALQRIAKPPASDAEVIAAGEPIEVGLERLRKAYVPISDNEPRAAHANPPGCICRYAHKSDPMCTYSPPGLLHAAPRDRSIWICSVCNGWNHVRDTFCTHTHAGSQPANGESL